MAEAPARRGLSSFLRRRDICGFVGVRDGVQVKKRAFYLALRMGLDGRRDVHGLWAAEAEGARFWLEILTELKNCRVTDILM